MLNDECHNFVLCLTIRWTMTKKRILFADRPDGRLVSQASYKVTLCDNLLFLILHLAVQQFLG